MNEPGDKNIYRYCNGREQRFGDPWAIRRQLVALLREPHVVLQNAQSSDPERAYAALGQLVQASRAAFSLPPFDDTTGEGATDEHALGVLRGFLDWLRKKKATADCRPTSAPPMGSAS